MKKAIPVSFTLLLAVVGYVSLSEVVFLAADSRPLCERGADFVRRNAALLPQTYAEFIAVPRAYRPVVYSALGSETKSAVWREHASRFLKTHGDLTDTQRSFAAQLNQLFDRFALADTTQTRLDAREYEQRANEMLGTSLTRELLYIQAAGDAYHHGFAAKLALAERLRSFFALTAETLATCSCGADDECGTGDLVCDRPIPPCAATPGGCGPLGLDPCWGKCVPATN